MKQIFQIKYFFAFLLTSFLIPSAEAVISGSNAGYGEFPSYVQIWVDGEAIGEDKNYVYAHCGGTLISSNRVLTAAHCFYDGNRRLDDSDFYVLPNFHSFKSSLSFSDLIEVHVVTHHNYDHSRLGYNDIAVLKLKKGVSGVTAGVYGGDGELSEYPAIVNGTGSTVYSGFNQPRILRKADIHIESIAVCSDLYSGFTKNTLCAGVTVALKGACQGDSGSPLWAKIGGKKLPVGSQGKNAVVGIVSGGKGPCNNKLDYGLFARTSSYIGFIKLHAPHAHIVTDNLFDPASLLPILFGD